MSETFLIGGGWRPEARPLVYEPFVRAAGGHVALVVLAGEDAGRFAGALQAAGARELDTVVVPADGPAPAPIAAGGVFVCGGPTPGYRAALAGCGWMAGHPVYAGFSAGAAIAAGRALVGGHRLEGRAVCPEQAGEDLEELTVLPGLDRVPFTVDVHAAQWGTTTRALSAVAAGLVEEVWALDEDTLVHVADGVARVTGLGAAHRMRRAPDGGVHVDVLMPGATVRVA